MFLGRERELNILRKNLIRQEKSVILVYGKRRIGKTSLIREAVKEFTGNVIFHTCVKSTYKGNLDLLSRSVCVNLGLPIMQFSTIFDLFDFLKTRTESLCLVIDEYPYFKESLKANELDSYFQQICDTLPDNIKLVFCGSHISIMKELIEEGNPLFGRFNLVLHLEEMDYLEASGFYPGRPIHEKIALYAVFGGSPYVLSHLEADYSIEELIEEHLLSSDGILRMHIENVMLGEIEKAYDIRIFEAIANGKKTYSEICDVTGESASGGLAKQLNHLLDMAAIKKTYPINRRTDKKKTFYEINDNLTRFYFAFLFGNESLLEKLGEKQYFRLYILKALDSFINLRLEDMVCQYFSGLSRRGDGGEIMNIGSLWYDDPRNRKNGQFDCVLETESGYKIFEVKNYNRQMTRKECDAEAEQVRNIPGIKASEIGFVSTGGFNFDTDEYQLIDGKMLYDGDNL